MTRIDKNESDILYLKDGIDNIEKSIAIYLKEYYTYMFMDKMCYTSKIETHVNKILKYIYKMYENGKIDFDEYNKLRYRVDDCLKDVNKKVIKDDEYVVFVPRELIKMNELVYLLECNIDCTGREIIEDDIKYIIESFEKGLCSLKKDYSMMTLENLVNYNVKFNSEINMILYRITYWYDKGYLTDEIHNDFKHDIERIKDDLWCWIANKSLTSDSIIVLHED